MGKSFGRARIAQNATRMHTGKCCAINLHSKKRNATCGILVHQGWHSGDGERACKARLNEDNDMKIQGTGSRCGSAYDFSLDVAGGFAVRLFGLTETEADRLMTVNATHDLRFNSIACGSRAVELKITDRIGNSSGGF